MKFIRIAKARVAPLLGELTREGVTPDLADGSWLGAVQDDTVLGVIRIVERGGAFLLDDLWVHPSQRTKGIASQLIAAGKARRRPVWIVVDEHDVPFYERRGFDVVAEDEFPDPLKGMYVEQGRWPRGADHAHVAMRWTGSS